MPCRSSGALVIACGPGEGNRGGTVRRVPAKRLQKARLFSRRSPRKSKDDDEEEEGRAMMDGSSSQQQHMDLSMRHGGSGGGGGMGMGLIHRPLASCRVQEEALGSSESEPEPMPARPRGRRARAAEVHNLSEKRRRCKINERMKALQSLVPNSSKADKASMLDEAIEYLKQLQLQVQMLSMRNLPAQGGAPEHLPAPQMCPGGLDHPVALLPVNQIPGAEHSFDPPNHDPVHDDHIVLPSVPVRTTSEPQFILESSQPNLQSLLLTQSAEMILQQDVMLNHHLSSTQETTSMPGHDMKPLMFDQYSIWKKQSEGMMPDNSERLLFMPHLHR